jgi:hypothetical protein
VPHQVYVHYVGQRYHWQKLELMDQSFGFRYLWRKKKEQEKSLTNRPGHMRWR